MRKIRTRESVVVTPDEEINLKLTLLFDNGQYTIIGETDEELEIQSCGDLGADRANRLLDILSSNAVMPGFMCDVAEEMMDCAVK